MKALGHTKARVAKKPRIGIISTGDELVDSPARLRLGKIVDLNRPILSGLAEELGAVPVDIGIARDNEGEIMNALRRALRVSDAVLISAGSSVGKRDLIPKCINQLGKPGVLVHGVAMRPALPTGLAVVKGKPVVSLPGFPVSAMIAFRAFCRPLIERLSGGQMQNELTVKAVLKGSINGIQGNRTYVRVSLSHSPDGLVAEPLKVQRSSALMSMVDANGIVTIPEGVASVEAGQVVDVAVIGEIQM
jgi:molybdenum cofactor synthesis domain-containing protein